MLAYKSSVRNMTFDTFCQQAAYRLWVLWEPR